MITRRDLLKTAGAVAALPLTSAAQTPDPSTVIWYDKPAATWNDALPVGNGHLGAMIFGRVEKERIQLNEHSLWSGRPNPDDDQPQTLGPSPKSAALLFEGNYAEANKLAQAKMMKPMNNETFGSYQTLGDLTLEFDHPAGEVTSYRRQLDLNTGVSTVTYQATRRILRPPDLLQLPRPRLSRPSRNHSARRPARPRQPYPARRMPPSSPMALTSPSPVNPSHLESSSPPTYTPTTSPALTPQPSSSAQPPALPSPILPRNPAPP